MSHYTVFYKYGKRARSFGGLFCFILIFYCFLLLDIRWLQPTQRHASRWLSIISYPTRVRGIIVNYRMIHENKCISYLFLIYFIFFYFETYVQGFPEEYVEETSLQILQLPKERHFSWVKSMRKGNSFAWRTLHTIAAPAVNGGSQNRAVLSKRHNKSLFLRL